MTWTLHSRTLGAFAVLTAGLASVAFAAFDNTRYDNVCATSLCLTLCGSAKCADLGFAPQVAM